MRGLTEVGVGEMQRCELKRDDSAPPMPAHHLRPLSAVEATPPPLAATAWKVSPFHPISCSSSSSSGEDVPYAAWAEWRAPADAPACVNAMSSRVGIPGHMNLWRGSGLHNITSKMINTLIRCLSSHWQRSPLGTHTTGSKFTQI